MKIEERLDEILVDEANEKHICSLHLDYDDGFAIWHDVRLLTKKQHPTAPAGYPMQYFATGRDEKGVVRDFMFYASEVSRIDRQIPCKSAKAVA